MTDLVIVTGASSGLGLALARNVPFPARVIDVSRSAPPDGDGIEHHPADLSEPSRWADLGEWLKETVAGSDPSRAVFVHAAATLTPIGFAGEVDPGDYADSVILNSASGQVLGQYFLDAVAGRGGVYDLVMISSGAAESVYAGWSSYGAGKAALNQWVRNVGAEQRHRGGVRVSAIAPGVVATAMQEQIRSAPESDFPEVGRFRDLHAGGELAHTDDAARRIWEVIESGVEPGSVLDIRDLA